MTRGGQIGLPLQPPFNRSHDALMHVGLCVLFLDRDQHGARLASQQRQIDALHETLGVVVVPRLAALFAGFGAKALPRAVESPADIRIAPARSVIDYLALGNQQDSDVRRRPAILFPQSQDRVGRGRVIDCRIGERGIRIAVADYGMSGVQVRFQARYVVDVVSQQIELLRALGQGPPRVLQMEDRFAYLCTQRGATTEFGARLLREIYPVAAAFQLSAQHLRLPALAEAVAAFKRDEETVHMRKTPIMRGNTAAW